MKKIQVSERICSDYEGYCFFIETSNQMKDVLFEDIIFDFSNTTWFEANLCAIMGAIINSFQDNINNVVFENINKKIEDVLNKNHFLASFGGYVIPDQYNTTIKYRRNKLTEEKLIKEFLYSELIIKHDFPKLSDIAQKEIIRSIFEIYSNAIIHGDCDNVYSCGQYYPGKKTPRIDFTIVDLGNTIKTNVNNFLQSELSGTEAIEWAVKEQNTTKQIQDNIPGGLGFKLISDFVKLNNGKIQIVSADGFWEIKQGQCTVKRFNNEFKGTIVNLEFNLDDKSFYYLKSEKVEDIIF